MELVLPRLSGYEVIKRLQKISLRTRSIPVIILSGKLMDEESKRRLISLEENVIDYITKPIMRASFMVKIHRILKTGISEKKILKTYDKERRHNE